MTSIEFLKYLFSMLDDCFQSSLYFQELKRIVFENVEEEFDTISVASSFYEKLPENSFLVEVGPCILNFESGPLSLSIAKEDGTFLVELSLTKDDSITNTVATIADFSRIETTVVTLEDSSYVGYDTKIYYYSNNKPTPLEIIGEEDFNFAKWFHIPLRLAHYFRINFGKMGNLFNRYDELENFDSFESFLEDSDYYAFIGPVATSNFVGFIKEYCYSHFSEGLLEVFSENGRFDDIKPEREAILTSIVSVIGNDGDVVLSYPFYQAILLYLTGCMTTLNAKGFILKLVDGFYTLYCVSFEDSVCHIESYEVTPEQVQTMYEQNEFNKENDSFLRFFDIDYGR